MKKKLKMGLIGFGKVSRHSHFPALLDIPEIDLKYVADLSKDSLSSLDAYDNIKKTTDYKNILNSKYIDIVDIATPGKTHFKIASEFLENGKDVIIEKPPTLSLKEFDELLRLSNDLNRKAYVILNYRYKPEFKKGLDEISSGKTGIPRRIVCIHHGFFVFADAPWRFKEEDNTYLLYDYSFHYIDLIMQILGEVNNIRHFKVYHEENTGIPYGYSGIFEHDKGDSYIEFISNTLISSNLNTEFNIYCTGKDVFISNFPPKTRFYSSVRNPYMLLKNEFFDFSKIIYKIISNKFNKERNISHYYTLNSITTSCIEGSESPFELKNNRNLMELLDILQNKYF
jgi:predicted dehydrogenase